MKAFGTVVSALVYIAVMVVAGLMFGIKAIVLMAIACICTVIAVLLHDDDGFEEDSPERESCEGCKHYIGGGHCKINLEDECCEGGGFEAWEEEDE